MKNGDKIINALRVAFPGHAVEYQYKQIANVNSIFIDRVFIGSFEHDFFEQDFDNPEIEIKVKAPLYKIKDFLEEVDCDGVFYRAVERGFKEWEEGLRSNN